MRPLRESSHGPELMNLAGAGSLSATGLYILCAMAKFLLRSRNVWLACFGLRLFFFFMFCSFSYWLILSNVATRLGFGNIWETCATSRWRHVTLCCRWQCAAGARNLCCWRGSSVRGKWHASLPSLLIQPSVASSTCSSHVQLIRFLQTGIGTKKFLLALLSTLALKRLYRKEDNHLLNFCEFLGGRSSNISQKYILGNFWEYFKRLRKRSIWVH